jgi:hypothetical protein
VIFPRRVDAKKVAGNCYEGITVKLRFGEFQMRIVRFDSMCSKILPNI